MKKQTFYPNSCRHHGIIFVGALILLCCLSTPPSAAYMNFNSRYVLKLPKWGNILNTPMRAGEYDISFASYPVTLSPAEGESVLITPRKLLPGESWERWNNNGTTTKGWLGTIDSQRSIEISGVMIQGYFLGAFELTGTLDERGIAQGDGVFRFMEERPNDPASPYINTFKWALDLEYNREPVVLSNKIIYHGPRLPPVEIPTFSSEEMAQYPFTDDLQIKRFAKEEPYTRERFYKGLPQENKEHFDALLTELTWDELPHIPGVLLLINHLAGVEPTYQQTVAEKYVRDESYSFFGDLSFEELQSVPPLFATLYVQDNMPVQGLQEASPRFATMLEAYHAVPAEELADLAMQEFIMKISELLPEEFRREYYGQSPKLRAYVTASKDERLRELYPF